MKKIFASLILILLLCSGCSDRSNGDESSFQIYYFSVGHGDAALVMCDGHNMMIDCGSRKGNSEGIQSMYRTLEELNIEKFDYIFVSHPDDDHYSLFKEVLKNRSVSKVFCSTKSDVVNNSEFNAFENSFKTIFKQIKVPDVGDEYMLGSAKIEVLAVNTTNYSKSSNDSSIVLMITYGNNKFLFTGDAENKTENELKNKDIKCDVLKVAHHGSKTSSGEQFLLKANPKYAIFSVSSDDVIDGDILDTLETMNPKTQVLRTDKGTIICTSDGNKIKFTNHQGEQLTD